MIALGMLAFRWPVGNVRMHAKKINNRSLLEQSDAEQQAVSDRLSRRQAAEGLQSLRRPASPVNQAPVDLAADEQAGTTDALERLSREVALLERGGRKASVSSVLSTGCSDMDALLPQGGYEPGSVIEYLRRTPACGASHLALAAAAAAMKPSGGFLVIVDPDKQFYPPALAGHGIDLAKVIFVRPDSVADTIWSIDQALRTDAVAAVVAEVNCLDDRSARRLQLAAQRGGGLGLLLRRAAARGAPSWAEVQWVVKPAMGDGRTHSGAPINNRATAPVRRIDVQLARLRGGNPGKVLRLAINGRTGNIQSIAADERSRHEAEHHSAGKTDAVHLAAQLANTTHSSRRATAG